ncbi:MAG: PAS domain S-box protein [Anaerolineae bacterium]|jgi:PAS domain S-box-containing protein
MSENKMTEDGRRRGRDTLTLINALNHAANQGASLQEIIDLFCRQAREAFAASGATLYLLDQDREHLVLQNIALPPHLVRAIERLIGMPIPAVRIPLEPGSVYADILQSDKPQIIDDPVVILQMMAEHTQSPALQKLVPAVAGMLGYASVLTVPLAADGEPVGLMDMGRDGLCTEADLRQFAVLAEQFTVILRRKQDEAALRRMQKEWEGIFQAIGHPTLILDPRHTVISANRAAAAAAGARAQDLVGRPCYQVFHGTDAPPAGCPMLKMMASDRVEMVEMRMEALGGTFLVSCTPMRHSGRGLERVIHIATDISERVRAEEALRKSEALLRKSQEIAHIGSWHLDLETNKLTWSDEVYRIFGLEPARLDATYETFLNAVHPEDREMVEREYRSALEEQRPYEVVHRVLRPDGSVRIVHEKAEEITDESGAVSGSIGMVHDITERVCAEVDRELLLEQIHDQARQLQEIMDTVPEGVLLLDAEGRVALTNPVADRHLGVLVDAPVGAGPSSGGAWIPSRLGDRPLEELLTSPPQGLWHEVRAKGRTYEVIARPMAHAVTPAADGRPANGGASGPENWVLVIKDVTQEREAREQLWRQERLAVVGQLAAGIAHDFNNIMGTMVLYADMTARSEALSERGQEWMATIRDQAQRATRLIQQILDFSRRSVLERRPIDVLLLVKEEVKLLERTLPEHIDIRLTYGYDEYTVDADPTRMQQVVTNLAVNARDAMPNGGQLRIGLERVTVEPGRSPPLAEMEAGEWVCLTVADTGTGISPDALPHIFEPFFTTKETGTGTGLGLAQVHGIVGQHGGHISVDTVADRGSVFTIYLPALPVRAPQAPEPASVDLLKGNGERVLVVEDQASLRSALITTLQSLNYRVLEAASGEAALAMLERHEVALVMSDVVMPRMGGIALFHALHERGLDVPVVLLTGHPMEEQLEALLDGGLSGYLLKPPRAEDLANLLAELLG